MLSESSLSELETQLTLDAFWGLL